ncbi:MAG TPA: hypothetical protein VFI34_04900 [Candidatus Limnocylindrales bacterium]|nr:hypothetical protein [Candidatus Limnocylindrales bacterium]
MTTIFIDGSAALAPDAAAHLAHLPETGHDLVLVAPGDHATATQDLWGSRVTELPAEPPRGSWFVTSDPATCSDRRPGLRTLLIAPREEGPRPTRCDSRARDLRDAVLEILAADAMA